LALIVATILLGTREVWTMKNESLKKEELEQFRKELLALRERLSGNVRYLTQAALNQNEEGLAGRAGSSIHPAELGSDNYEQEFTLSLVENEKEVLERVDAALKAIEEGTYGKCEMCGQRIPKIRLKAIPYATTCVKCAEESERQASRSE
jgi:DnaK suppressor protein